MVHGDVCDALRGRAHEVLARKNDDSLVAKLCKSCNEPAMAKTRLLYALLLLGNLCACDVLKKAESCQQIASILSETAPLLEEFPLEASAQPVALRSKGKLYAQLAERLKNLEIKNEAVERERNALVSQLVSVDKQFQRAAAEASGTSPKKSSAAKEKTAPQPEAKVKPSPSRKLVPSPAITNKSKKKKPYRNRSNQSLSSRKRRYGQAKRSIEASVKKMNNTSKKLGRVCL